MADLIYSKYSNERSREFAVRTDIWEENQKRYVTKTALYPEGETHVENLPRWYEELEKSYQKEDITCNRCEKDARGIRLEYVQGQTLEEMMDYQLEKGELEQAKEQLRDYLTKVQHICAQEPFVMTEKFRKVFGELQLPQGMTAAKITNIDMVCENLVLTQPPCVLDYEWTFDFPVPCEFVLYRIIHYYFNTNLARKVLQEEDFYQQFGITGDQRSSFEIMEKNFQSYLTGGHVPMREMYQTMSPGVQTIKTLGRECLQIYFSFGKGYQEEFSVIYDMVEGKIDCTVEIPENCVSVRIDPGDLPCAVKLEKVAFDGVDTNLSHAVTAAGCISGQWAFIPVEDPWIGEIIAPKGAKQLTVSLSVYGASEKVIHHVQELEMQNREIGALQAKLQQQAHLIQEMKHTKIWKFYENYKKLMGRRKKHE